MRVSLGLPLLLIAGLGTGGLAFAAEPVTPAPSGQATAAPQQGQAPASGQASQQAATEPASGNPQDIAKSAEKSTLKSPYPDFASAADDGHKKFMSAGCNGCHGGTGGGGMGPPLTNPVWVYGSDDDTLFRLISLGSDELKKQGYTRKGSENVVGPMPPMGGVLKESLWKVIAWIRLVNPSSAGGGTAPSASATPSGAAPAAPSGAPSPAPSAPLSAQ